MGRKTEPRRIWVTRWLMPDGTAVKPRAKGAKKERVRTSTYYAYVRGKRVALGTDNLGEAWEKLRKLLRGGEDETAAAYQRADLAELLEEWLRVRKAKGTGQEQLDLLRGRLTKLFALAGWKRAGDITDDTLTVALAALQEDTTAPRGRTVKGGRSARTRNHHLTHAKAFCSWLSRRTGRQMLRDDHDKIPVEPDQRHPRRCPAADEDVRKLFDHLDRGPVIPPPGLKWDRADPPTRCRMSARQRAMAYRVAMATGLRADEVRTLTWDSFDLEADHPTVAVEAGYSKHRRRDVQPLPLWLVDLLRSYRNMGGGLWSAFPEKTPGRVLQDDLKRAGVPYRTAEGFFDFHSLRVWYCTALANQPGISPKTLQALCRHSTPSLTLAIYARARVQDQRDAVNRIPPPA